jgi:hypothetical protein
MQTNQSDSVYILTKFAQLVKVAGRFPYSNRLMHEQEFAAMPANIAQEIPEPFSD